MDAVAIVRASYEAYVAKDRAAIERLIARNFRFTSPLDNRIDRATYFERCWPNSKHIAEFEFIHLFEAENRVFANYIAKNDDGHCFQNAEILQVHNGQITAVEVYFGWSVPHEAPEGQFVDKSSN